MAIDEKTAKKLEQFGAGLKKIRKEKGYSNYEYFSYENGINRAQYGRYERGEDIRLSTLLKIVSALGMTLEEFSREVGL